MTDNQKMLAEAWAVVRQLAVNDPPKDAGPKPSDLNGQLAARAMEVMKELAVNDPPKDAGPKAQDLNGQLAARAMEVMKELALNDPPKDDAPRGPDVSERMAMQSLEVMKAQASQPEAPPVRLLKNTLNGGELSPELGARFDQPRHNTGMSVCENMIPLPQGGITRRPPLRSLAVCLGAACRLVPFVFSSTDTALLEFYEKPGGVGLRVWRSPTEHVSPGLSLAWAAGILKDVCFCQSADTIYYAHPSLAPGKITRHSLTDWRQAQIKWLPDIAAPSCSLSTSVSGDASGGKVDYYYRCTAVSAETGEESLPGPVAGIYNYPLTTNIKNVITVSPVAGAAEYRVYKQKAGVFGFIGRIADGQLEFYDANIAADTEDTPPKCANPFDGPGKYPSIVFLHQQRLGYASSNSRPLTFWLSQSGNYENMGASSPPAADDAIEATLASQDASRIVWAQSDRDGLAFGTEGGEWVLASSEGAAITPGDLSFQPQTFYGSQPGLPALRAGGALLYVQKGSRAIREYGYSFQEDRYQSSDLTLLARHILKAKVTSWAWQGEPHGIAWLTLADGTLAGLTYLREHDVIAWHRHSTRWGSIMQCCCVPGFASQNTLCLQVARANPATEKTEYWLEYLEDIDTELTESFGDSTYQYAYSGTIVPCFGEVQTEGGTSFAMIKKINGIKVRAWNSHPFNARVTSQDKPDGNWTRVPFKKPAYRAGLVDWHAPLKAGFRDNPRLEMRFNEPATILGITIAVELGDVFGNE